MAKRSKGPIRIGFLDFEIGPSGLAEISWTAKPSPIGLGWYKSALQAENSFNYSQLQLGDKK